MLVVRRSNKAGSQPALLPTKLSPLLSLSAKGADIAVMTVFLIDPRYFRSIGAEEGSFELGEVLF